MRGQAACVPTSLGSRLRAANRCGKEKRQASDHENLLGSLHSSSVGARVQPTGLPPPALFELYLVIQREVPLSPISEGRYLCDINAFRKVIILSLGNTI